MKKISVVLLIIIIIILLSGCEEIKPLVEGKILNKGYHYSQKEVLREITNNVHNVDLKFISETYTFIIFNKKKQKEEKIYVDYDDYLKYDVGDTYKGYNLFVYIKFSYLKLKYINRNKL